LIRTRTTAVRRLVAAVAVLTLGGALVLAGEVGEAGASNGEDQRIPPEFGDVPCLLVVDRSTDPVFHIEWTILEPDPNPDLPDDAIGPDEVPNSRRHQFFAFGSQYFQLPKWITQADVDAAAAADALFDPGTLLAEDILETAPNWSGPQWSRINADDARIPITFENADAGLDWDTSGVPAGTYVIAGYVWEPRFNDWSNRLGAIKVVDGADPADVGPAGYVQRTPDLTLDPGDTVTLGACVDAMPGTTYEVDWAEFSFADELDWQPISGPLPVDGDEVEFEYEAPTCTDGGPVRVRVTLTDPEGRSYVAYTPDIIAVFPGDACEEETDEEGDSSDGGCSVPGSGSHPWWAAGIALIASRRRQRRRLD
jgi:hypothetical protein